MSSRVRSRDNGTSRSSYKLLYATLAVIVTLVYYKSTKNEVKAAAAAPPQSVLKSAAQRRSAQQQIPFGVKSDSYNLTQRIVAVGDIHGDYPALESILRMAQLIDFRGNWIGGNTVLVQTGDLVDRGPDLIAITRFFDTLRPQAEKVGGHVQSLLGNHEYMNALGDLRYVTREDIASFGGERQRRIALSTGFIGQTWRTNYSTTARVPFTHNFASIPSSLQDVLPSTPLGSSSRAFVDDYIPAHNVSSPFTHAAASFVHGGITPEYLSSLDLDKSNKKGYLSRINSIGHSILEDIVARVAPLSLPNSSIPEQRVFWSERGPMWARDYALEQDERSICARAQRAADMLRVRHLIMGHTPNFEGVLSRCDGLILLIDTGISKAYGGAHSALEIVYSLTPEDDGIRTNERWIEKETVKALYTGGRANELLASKERTVVFSPQ